MAHSGVVELILSALASRERALVALWGIPGSGKTTAALPLPLRCRCAACNAGDATVDNSSSVDHNDVGVCNCYWHDNCIENCSDHEG
jgi:hypothetical protein